MPVLDLNDKNKVKKYNEFLIENNASLMQSINWGGLKNNWKQEIVYLEENNKIIASMSILLKKLPIFNSYMMYAPRGPIVKDIKNVEIVNRLVEEAKVIAKKYNAFVLKFDPEVRENEEIKNLYKKNGYKLQDHLDIVIQPRNNMILQVENETEESLMKRFSEKTRYNIRLAKRKGVNVTYSTKLEDLQHFYKLYEITTVRDEFGKRPYEYFVRMLESFKEYTRIYISWYEGEPLSGAICINYAGKAFYIYGASSNSKRNLMPNYLMQYEMIKWALETNCKEYNFGGVLYLTNEHGLYKFKNGFCKKEGATTFMGEIDKVYKPFLYFAYTYGGKFVKQTRKLVRKIKGFRFKKSKK